MILRKSALLTVFVNFIIFVLSRLPPDSRTRRDAVSRVLWQIPEVAYFRLRDFGFRPSGIIDVGAHVGDWTRSIRKVFPVTPVLMIEARQSQSHFLERACRDMENVDYSIALLGSESRDAVEFYVHDTGSSLFSERSNVTRSSSLLHMTTLDEVVNADLRLKAPLFLKLDVQGAELEVLRGAMTTISIAEVVQLEIQILNYNEGAPSAAQVIAFMDDRGFAIFDIAGFVRPNGEDLVQMDVIFVRKDLAMRHDFFQYPAPL